MTKWTTKNIPSQRGRSAGCHRRGRAGLRGRLAPGSRRRKRRDRRAESQKGADAVVAIKKADPGAQVQFGEWTSRTSLRSPPSPRSSSGSKTASTF